MELLLLHLSNNDLNDYRDPKLLGQVMKVPKRVAENFLYEMGISDIQFGFMTGRGATKTKFIVHQLNEKFHAVN